MPPMNNLLEPRTKAPFARVQFPVIESVRFVPRFSVPPGPFRINALPLIFPVKVAVPPVLSIEIRPVEIPSPVVVNPAIFWVAVPEIVIKEDPASNFPVLRKSPKNVSE